MSGTIRDLKVWQEAVTLASEVVRTLRPANRREIKAVVEEAMHSAIQVATLVAEGYSCYDLDAQHERYRTARRELACLETHLAIARQSELVTAPAYTALGARMQAVHRLLGGYLIYIDRLRTQPVARDPASTAILARVPGAAPAPPAPPTAG